MKPYVDVPAATCRHFLGAFVQLAFKEVYPGHALTPNWHIDAVCYRLQRMLEGTSDSRLVLNQPPRSLKSYIVSVCYPAWVLGHDPSKAVIVACYSDELSRKFSRECRRLMESHLYKRVFPWARINPRKASETELETTLNGGRYATSVGGTLTGRGADVLIVDDPIKAQDAQSELARENVREWFNKTAYSRLNRKGRSLAIVHMQRLHAHDLSGSLIEAEWPRLVLPAIASGASRYQLNRNQAHYRKMGELLQPDWDTLESLGETKRQLGSAAFAAQYQQDPVPPEGNLIKAEWLLRYDNQMPRERYKHVVVACDPAGKPGEENDYTAIVVAGVANNNLHILHVSRGHWTLIQMRMRIVELAGQYRSDLQIIEDTATGMGLIQDLRRETRLGVKDCRPRLSKEDRAFAQLGLFEGGRVLLPREAGWLADFEKELLGFPSAKYDDQVDALLIAMEWFRQAPQPVPLVGPILITSPRWSFDGHLSAS